MARYITREILCEAYTHLDIQLYDDKEALKQLKIALQPFFEERARFLLGDNVEIQVKFEPGSLRTKLTVYGSAGAILLNVINGYGSFRQGVTSLTRDVSSLAESANLEVLFRTRTPYCDRINIEKRKGVFGRVDALIANLDAVSSSVLAAKRPTNDKDILNANGQIDRLAEWGIKANRLFEKLEDPETIACVSEGLGKELNQIPVDFQWSSDLNGSSLRSQSAQSDPNLFGKLQGISARYKATLQALKNEMTTRLSHSQAQLEK